MTIGSLFSGIGGLELGLEWAGFGPTLWQVEQCPKLRNCLATHWPDAERFEDVCDVGAANLVPVDIICGGFPCQDVSSAGKRVGLSGARSGLWSEMARVVGELRPAWVVVENVASGATKWVDHIRLALAQLRYASLPVPIAASDCGLPHRRARVFIVANRDRDSERLQHGRRSGPHRPEALQPGYARIEGTSADANGIPEREPHPQANALGRGREARKAPERGAWRTIKPVLVRGVHVIPNRVERITALGNAVAPLQAEVIGHVIRELAA